MRRRVPLPDILYYRMKSVFDFFKDKKDSTTGVKLFNEKNKLKFNNMILTVKRGYASDPPHMSMYVRKTDMYGRYIVDCDGLYLYRSLRGTSNLESLHQYLTTSFGHTVAGPWYSDILLTIVRHQYNWRMSRKNRPNFPQLMHYEGGLLDRINTLYEALFGYPKHRYWKSFNESLPVLSAYGIVGVNAQTASVVMPLEHEVKHLRKNRMLYYLGSRQKSILPFLPIRGVNERQLVHAKLNELVQNKQSLSNISVFENLQNNWNAYEVSVERKIYPKLACHFIRYVKSWRKNQDRRDAEISSGADRMNNVLEHVPLSQRILDFERVPLNGIQGQVEETALVPFVNNNGNPDFGPNIDEDDGDAAAMDVLCSVCMTRDETPVREKKKQKRRTCRVVVNGVSCSHPTTCPGRMLQQNCVLHTGGDPSKKVKRKITKIVKFKMCIVCKTKGCRGAQKRYLCPQYVKGRIYQKN